MKITLKRADLDIREGSVFVNVPAPAPTRMRADDYFSDWATVAREIAEDTPVTQDTEPTTEDPEPCRAKLCLNRNWVFKADSRHCQKRAGCILRKDSWNAKDREWLKCAGEAMCVAVGIALSWLSLIVF